ncbi:ABC transporter permease [Mesotoga sp. Brook.08.YT.4.2.5.1]|nr:MULTISPECIES: branched-chain amino acid ABC transporter permease [unclassified Mesotoga]PNE22481.1 ABC transporter permease [Mesotoga sp. Brook.08.YT.4.2.5.1]PXF34492.1 ABC transporter permease [Mesotoga sp. SC_NapDC]RAM60052.1 ABC transporter permease [Mesotoga sp. SC_3PWM13N19]PVD15603.1 ABC transporter permease [Mesotoga sp. Brook.08.105.5.1]RAO98158.1 ABC transporter permease [Mesotoga sp. Brook.08.YT.4.2.5.4.]
MEKISFLRKHRGILILVAILVVVAIWRPLAAIYGVQRGSLYALIGLPLALTLGVVGIMNLAHGDLLSLGTYIVYLFAVNTGMDPLVSIIPVFFLLFILGVVIYKLTVTRVLKAGHLNQLLLTFGISMIVLELMKVIWTTRPRSVYVDYSSSSTTIAGVRFGTYELLYVVLAFAVLIALQLFLKKTRLGQATFAVGQNPRGAKIVGINTDFVYLFVFGLSVAILGIAAGVMVPRFAIFPSVGAAFTMKSFSLVAMAGLGNLTGILISGIVLGVGEAIVQSIPGYAGWSDIVFFGVLIAVIMIRSLRRQSL